MSGSSGKPPQRILVDFGGYGMCNLGDTTMLQIALERMGQLFPAATFYVLTGEPTLLEKFCPGALPVSLEGRTLFLFNGTLVGQGLHRRFPHFERTMRLRFPALTGSLIGLKKKALRTYSPDLSRFLETLRDADLVVAAGGGYVNDSFYGHARTVVEMLALAARLGKPTAMFGQGIGPLDIDSHFTFFQKTMPSLRLVALREGHSAPALVKRLGVADDCVVVTGDDAVELVYRERRETLGNDIGINVRLANYSGLDTELLQTLRDVVGDVRKRHGAMARAIPIARCPDGDDSSSLADLLGGDGGRSLETPVDVIREVGKCRLVVTGSYHAGVFALAQGIPVICLSNSAYYDSKFAGLAQQFGGGCTIVPFAAPDFAARLTEAIEELWEPNAERRERLLARARQQVEAGRAAYSRLREFFAG